MLGDIIPIWFWLAMAYAVALMTAAIATWFVIEKSVGWLNAAIGAW
jgi:hypothetical protein